MQISTKSYFELVLRREFRGVHNRKLRQIIRETAQHIDAGVSVRLDYVPQPDLMHLAYTIAFTAQGYESLKTVNEAFLKTKSSKESQ